MSELSELIRIGKNIESQNEEIIRLLKIIAGEDDSKPNNPFGIDWKVDDLVGEGYFKSDDPLGLKSQMGEIQKIEETPEETIPENPKLLHDVTCDVGDVLFVEGSDVYLIGIENNEITVNNLTGDDEPIHFNLQEFIANESIKNNQSLDDSTVILNEEQSQNLSESLRVCFENGAKKVYVPWSCRGQLLFAPPMLMEVLQIDFYKSEEELIEKLFN